LSPGASVGLFSTLTSTGSRALLSTITAACAQGRLPGVRAAFVFCNREAGESALTDETVGLLEEGGTRVIRASAARFQREARLEARRREAGGDSEPMWAWRDAFFASYRRLLPDTDLDLLLGDMWIWGRRQCAERRGVNLHPALPSGPLGKMWFDVVWDLVASDAQVSGVMLHRVTPDVDRGPVATWCAYSLRTGDLAPLWASLPDCAQERSALIATQRTLKREATHPLFLALRARGLARELPLMLETVRSVADGRLRLEGDGVVDAAGRELPDGLDLTDDVERSVGRA
jgi:phosphoribosylglycinamide formyltransferase-1